MAKTLVVCISGKAQHGKDTTANFMKKYLEDAGKRVLIAHYGDQVKYICKQFFGWNGEKDEPGRTLLQRVGTDVIRAQSENHWVDRVLEILQFFPDEWDYVLIPDCRFPNEIERVAEADIDAVHLRIIRPNFKSPLTEEQQNHPSETALDNSEPDVLLLNDGDLAKLRAKTALIALSLLAYDKEEDYNII